MRDTWPEGPTLASYRQGTKKLLSGVTLVTAARGDTPFGLVSTNIAQVGGEPPTLIIVVNKAASCHGPIAESGAFCVNILAASQQSLFDCFAQPARRAERFATGDWCRGLHGLPVLKDALASFQCEVTQAIEQPGQTIFLGRVRELAVQADAGLVPLAYFEGSLC